MKMQMVALALVLGCVRPPALTPREHCAADGLLLAGLTHASSGGVGVATSGGRTTVASTSSYSSDVSCVRPVTIPELCEVRGAQISAQEKLSFSTGWRNGLVFVGFVAFIAPGLILYLVFDHQSDAAGEQAERNGAALRANCP